MILSNAIASGKDSFNKRDRQARHISATYIPDLDQDGEVKGFVALISDISDRKAISQMKDEFISVVSPLLDYVLYLELVHFHCPASF